MLDGIDATALTLLLLTALTLLLLTLLTLLLLLLLRYKKEERGMKVQVQSTNATVAVSCS